MKKTSFLLTSALLCAGFVSSDGHAGDFCGPLLEAWSKIQTYQCTYRAVTLHEGKRSETLLTYSYKKPNLIRMDIEKPKKGAVLIYNPAVSPKVRIRPFPKFQRFTVSYDLTDKKVRSDSGGTIDRSDLGSRVHALCEDLSAEKVSVERSANSTDGKSSVKRPVSSADGKNAVARTENFPDGETEWTAHYGNEIRKLTFGPDKLLRKIELYNPQGELTDSFEWKDLKTNLPLAETFFTKF